MSENWWGSTLSKLKTALSKTRAQLVDPIHDESLPGGDGIDTPANFAPEAKAEAEPQTSGQATADHATASQAIASSTAQSALPGTPGTGNPLPESSYLDASSPSPRPISPPASSTVVTQAPVKPPKVIDDEYLEDLEETLIRADIGLTTAEQIVEDLRRGARQRGWNSGDVEGFLKREFETMLATAPSSQLNLEPGSLNVILVVGVNGTGKTTSIGKLCWRLKQDGKRVLIAAADTFRAAAETQLEIWAERAGVDIVRLADGADPGSVVFQALQKARSEAYEVLIIDTAGRLHNKANLMAELKKVRAVIDKHAAECPLESLLVVDASIGQNGLQQARVFTEFCPLTGVILTKLDGSAKGGIVFSIARDMKLPVKLIGLGEKIDDLRDFDPQMFVDALFS